MNTSRKDSRSPYMEWAKLRSGARFNLSASGVESLPLAELGVSIDQLEINGASIYGYDPLLRALARILSLYADVTRTQPWIIATSQRVGVQT